MPLPIAHSTFLICLIYAAKGKNMALRLASIVGTMLCSLDYYRLPSSPY